VAVQTKRRRGDSDARSEPNENSPRLRKRRAVERSVYPRPIGFIHRPWYLSVKAAADAVVALVLLLVALPIIGLAALVVKLTSRGPAFYTQTRVGQYGQLFTIVKLRTMVDKCESLTGPRWSIPGDPRVTRIGQFLRATHLDELPQLINVLRGDMSIIGPRPERPEFLPNLERSLPGYRDRLMVRPGVTGLAQVQLPADTDLESVRRKLRYDLYYVEHASLWLDVRIMLCTGLYAAGVPFWIAGKLFAVPDSETIEPNTEPASLPETALPRPRVAA
jgi:lipopolysaccharide/colanic/teichoic acid biosynthesis glycosyltransferase